MATDTAGRGQQPTPAATAARRCRCREACLSPLRASDATVATPAGPALAVHLHPTVYAVADLTSLTSPLSVVGAK